MNKNRRLKLTLARSYLEKAVSIVEAAKDEEQDCIDNLPENLQNSERCTIMEDAVDELEEAIDNIESAIENIDKAKQ